jgi:hypothetical protein
MTQAVLERFRELGASIKASTMTKEEAYERAGFHWHRLYEKCWCGYLTVPAKYYTYDSRGIQTNAQEDAEKAYLASLSPSDVPSGDNPVEMSPLCSGCSERPPETGRSLCAACRKRAYRERSK